MKNRCVFLDRDGVLNQVVMHEGKPRSPSLLKDFILYEEARPALERLKKNNFLLVVVTNKPDISEGIQSLDALKEMNDFLAQELPIDDIRVCFDKESHFYKPNPGMLLEAAFERHIDVSLSYMVGDRWRDIGAGKNAGCKKTILIDRHYSEKMVYQPDFTCSGLTQAVDYILADS